MRSKEEIEWALAKEYQYLDDHNHPMDEMQWAHNQGWIKALEFVLDHKKEKVKDITHITKGANNDTIRRALKRLSKDCGFGRRDNVIDSKANSIHNSRVEQYKQCAP